MRATNATRNVTLAAFGRRATGLWDRSKGLLGRKGIEPGDGLLIDPCSGIHTFFMAFPIDAVFVDREGTVIHLAMDIAPQRMSRYVFKARAVLELPAGTVQSSGTQVGDRLIFED